MIAEGTAADGAGAHGDDQLGRRRCFVGFKQGNAHVLSYRPCDHKRIGVARRSDDLNAKAPHVKNGGAQHIDVHLAAVAAAGAHLPQLEGTAEDAANLFAQDIRQLYPLIADDQVGAIPGRQTIVVAEADALLWTGSLAFDAKETSAQINLNAIFLVNLVELNSFRGTYLDTGSAIIRTFAGIDFRQSTKTIRYG